MRVETRMGDFEHPPEVFSSRLDDSGERRLSYLNDPIRSLQVQPFERFSFKADDGTDIHGFLVKPAR